MHLRDRGLLTLVQGECGTVWVWLAFQVSQKRIVEQLTQEEPSLATHGLQCLWKDGGLTLSTASTHALAEIAGTSACEELRERHPSFRKFIEHLGTMVPSGTSQGENSACRWNAFYKRSAFAARLLQTQFSQLAAAPFVAMHIRAATAVDLHKYHCGNMSNGIPTGCSQIADLRWSPEELCSNYLQAAYSQTPSSSTISREVKPAIYLSTQSSHVKDACLRRSAGALVTRLFLNIAWSLVF